MKNRLIAALIVVALFFIVAPRADASKIGTCCRTVVKYVTLPAFALGGWAVGHIIGGPVGLCSGISGWEKVWSEDKHE